MPVSLKIPTFALSDSQRLRLPGISDKNITVAPKVMEAVFCFAYDLCYLYRTKINLILKLSNKMKTRTLSLVVVLLALFSSCLLANAEGLSAFKLRNGATVYIWEDKSQPDVYGMVTFNVGAIDDPAEYTGLAHYLEHVMFKGTQTIGALDWAKEKPLYEQIIAKYDEMADAADQQAKDAIGLEINKLSVEAAQYAAANELSLLVDGMGGQNLNAGTGWDQTSYYNTFPPTQLEKWLELYSERFIDPVFRGFQTELEAVYEEYNMYKDNMGSNLSEFLFSKAFEGTPYARPIIGLPEHLKNPRLSRLIEFYNTWYGPENMAIILVGNVDAQTAIPLIRQKFERLPRREARAHAAMDRTLFKGRKELSEKLYYRPFLVMMYNGAPSNSQDEIALSVCASLLSNNQESGLLDKLSVDGDIMGASVSPVSFRNAGILMVQAFPSYDAGQRRYDSNKSVEKKILHEIDRLRNGEFTAEQLEAVKQAMIREYDMSMESSEFKAMMLASLFNTGSNPADIITYRDRVAAITADDVKAVVDKYLTNNYMVVNVQELRGDRKSEKLDKVAKPGYQPVEAVKGAKSAYAQYLESITVPAPVPEYCDFASVQEAKVNTRSKLSYTHNPQNDVFSLTLRYGVGKRRMPLLEYAVPLMNDAGIMAFLAPHDFKQAMARINATCHYSVSDDYMTVTLYGDERSLQQACQLLQRQILMPQLDEKQLQSIIGSEYSARMMEKESVESQQQATLQYLLYGENSDLITRKPLRDVIFLTITDLTKAFQEATKYEFTAHYVGTIPFEQVTDILSRNLPLMENEAPSLSPEVEDRVQYAENTIYFLPNDKAKQSNIYFLIEGKPFDIADDVLLEAFSSYFGAGFGSLVVDEIREKRAMAYSSYGIIQTPQLAGKNWCFFGYVGTQGDKTIDALDVYMGLLADMPEAREHFDVVKANMRESVLSHKPGFRSRSLVFEHWKRLGYTQDPAIDDMKRIDSLTFDDIVRFYQENIKGKPVAIAIVGNPKSFDVKALEKYGKVVKLQRSKLYSDDSLDF